MPTVEPLKQKPIPVAAKHTGGVNRPTVMECIVQAISDRPNLSITETCKQVGLTQHLVLLMRHLLSKESLSPKRPFDFLRVKYRRKNYDLDEVCNTVFLKELLDQNYTKPKDELLRLIDDQSIKLSYPKLRYALDKYSLKASSLKISQRRID